MLGKAFNMPYGSLIEGVAGEREMAALLEYGRITGFRAKMGIKSY
jgi:hypothetical protein